MKFYEKLSADLNSGDDSRVQFALGAIYWIADLHKFSGDANTIPEDEPYVEELRSVELDTIFTSGIKELLRGLIKSDQATYRASAIGLLGTFADSNDKKLISEHLEMALIQLLSSNGVLHQSISALDSLSEIDLGDGSLSLADANRNIEYARAYLRRSGKEFAW